MERVRIKNMKKNLGGWWRLWIVLSVIYAGLVVVYTAGRWPDLSQVSHHPAFIFQMTPQAQIVINRPKSLAELEQALIEADRNGDTQNARDFAMRIQEIRKNDNWEDAPRLLEMPNGHRFEVAGDTKPEQATMVIQEYTRVLQLSARDDKVAASLKGFLTWLLPSLLICALGFSGAWIRRGFAENG